MAIVTYRPSGASPTGEVNGGNGIAFDVGAALASGGGQFTVDDSVNPLLVSVLDHYPGLQRLAGTPVYTDTITPLQAHTGAAPAAGDVLVRGADGFFAPVPVGATGQTLRVRADGTISWQTPPEIPLSAWASAAAPDNTSSTQQAINTAQTNGQTLAIDGNFAHTGYVTYDMGKDLIWDFKSGSQLRFTTDLALAAPTAVAAVAQAGTTTFGAQTNYYRVTAFNANGEGLASTEVSVTLTAGQQAALSWTNPTGTTSVRVYRGTAAGGESVYYSLGAVTSYTDTNAATSGGAHPPLNGRTYYIKATGTDQDGLSHYKVLNNPRIVGSGGVLAASQAGPRLSKTHGVQLAPKMGLNGRGLITGCNAGVDFYGDHQNLTGEIACRGNYIGALWGPDPYGAQIGDHLLSGADFSNNAFAGISISPTSNQLYKDVFLRVHTGFNPIPVHIEAQGSAADAITRTDFIGCHMESFSNALLWSASANNNLTGVRFIACTGYWDTTPAHQLAGMQVGWNIWNVGVITDCEIDNCDALSNVGSVGVIAAQYVYTLEWRVGQAVLDNLAATTKPILQALSCEGFTVYGKGRTCRVFSCTTSTIRNDLVQFNGVSGTGPAVARYVAAAVGSQAPIAGVAYQASPTAAFQNFVPVAMPGSRATPRNVVATSSGQYLVPDTANNGAVVSQAAYPGAGVILVGKSLAAGGANATTDCILA